MFAITENIMKRPVFVAVRTEISGTLHVDVSTLILLTAGRNMLRHDNGVKGSLLASLCNTDIFRVVDSYTQINKNTKETPSCISTGTEVD
jgi:hypothetical protein